MKDQNIILPKFYSNFALIFFSATILLLIFIFYLVWARVTIVIQPSSEAVDYEFTFNVKEYAEIPSYKKQDFVNGKIFQFEFEDSKSSPASGSKPLLAGVAGEVTIVNNYSQPQTLTETTRLVAPENPDKVLVRLKKTITVPAGQTMKVQVYFDNQEVAKVLPPMRFIIPGLWGPLQDKIYAENENNLGDSSQSISVVTDDDFNTAKKNLEDELYKKAISEVNQQLQAPELLWPKLVSADASEVSYDVKVGDETSEFSANLKIKAVVIVFDESQVLSMAREQIKNNLAAGQQLVSLNPKDFSYSIDNYDFDQKTAVIRAVIKGNATITESSELLNKDELTGKTKLEIQAYFSQYPEIESVELKFVPAWLKKTPQIKDKIQIEIVN